MATETTTRRKPPSLPSVVGGSVSHPSPRLRGPAHVRDISPASPACVPLVSCVLHLQTKIEIIISKIFHVRYLAVAPSQRSRTFSHACDGGCYVISAKETITATAAAAAAIAAATTPLVLVSSYVARRFCRQGHIRHKPRRAQSPNNGEDSPQWFNCHL